VKIAIVSDDRGWHGARLRQAFRAHGVGVRLVSLRACRIDLTHGCNGIAIPGFERRLPDGVFVRGISGGTLEQIVLRLDVLHALREMGIPVYNDARAIERTVDKGMTSFLLLGAGVATPPTCVTESPAQARAWLLRETAVGHAVVVKPLFGAQGVGLRRLTAGSDIPEAAQCNGVWYLQRYVETGAAAMDGSGLGGAGGGEGESGGWHDWRVFVIGGVAVAAMLRHGATWINNVAQGGRCEAAVLDPELQRLAVRACAAVGADYAGVDLIRDREGLLQVLEVNGVPAWRGLQSVTRIDIAECLVRDFLSRPVATRLATAPAASGG
jgi:tetrahydromethanopterin:alpha-L-glutamate ligase